jgi:hypothetical protein
MLHKQKSLARMLTAGLAIATLAPATAGAVPIIDAQTTVHVVKGQAVAAGGGSGVTPDTLIAPAKRTVTPNPDQQPGGSFKPVAAATPVPRSNPDQQPGGGFKQAPQTAPGMPTWPLNPQPIVGHTTQPATAKPADDGLSTWAIVLIAVGGVVVVATAGLGLSRRKRVKAA